MVCRCAAFQDPEEEVVVVLLLLLGVDARALVAPLVQSLKHEMVAGDSTLAEAAGLTPTSMREAIALAVGADDGTLPHAFKGPSKRNRRHLVRSVQRMELPEGWS